MSEISGSIFRDDRSDKKREKKSDTSKNVGDNHVSYKEFMKIVKKTRIIPSSYKNFPHFHEISPEQQIEDIIVRKKKRHIDNEQTFDIYSGDISNDNTEESNKYVSYKEFLRRVKKTRVTPLSSEGLPNFGVRSLEQPLNDIKAGKKKVEIETKQTFDMHSGDINVDKAEESNKHVSYEDFLRRVKKTRITPLISEGLPNFEMKPQEQIIKDGIGVNKKVDKYNEKILMFKSKSKEKELEKKDKTLPKVRDNTKTKSIIENNKKIKEKKIILKEEEKKKDTTKPKEETPIKKQGSREVNRKNEEKDKNKNQEYPIGKKETIEREQNDIKKKKNYLSLNEGSPKIYGIVYKITNLKNNKIYIGETTESVNKRFGHHISDAKAKRKGYLANALRKYGTNSEGQFSSELVRKNFKIEKIDSCKSPKELHEKEILWIAKCNSMDNNIGYNLLPGGLSSMGGELNPFYRKIDENLLEQSIKKQYTLKEIRKELGIAEHTIENRIQNIYNKSICELRDIFLKQELEPLIKKGLKKKEISKVLKVNNNYLSDKIQKFFNKSFYELRDSSFLKPKLESLIEKGLNGKEIAKELNLSSHSLTNKIQKFFNKSFYEVRDSLFLKPKLESLIEKGLNGKEIAKEINLSSHSLSVKIQKFFNKSFYEVRDSLFLKPKLESLIEKGLNRKEICRELNIKPDTFSGKIKKIFNKSIYELRDSLYYKSKLELLIKKNLNREEICRELNIKPGTFSGKIKKIFNKSLYELRDSFFCKPKLAKPAIEKGLSSEKISHNLKKNPSDFSAITKELFNKKLPEIRDSLLLQKIMLLYKKGLNYHQIAEKFKMDSTTVSFKITKYKREKEKMKIFNDFLNEIDKCKRKLME